MLTEALSQLPRSPPEISATSQPGQGDDGQHHNGKHERAHQYQGAGNGSHEFAQQARTLHLLLRSAVDPETQLICMH